MSQAEENLRSFLRTVESMQRKGQEALAQEFQEIKNQTAVFRLAEDFSTEVGRNKKNIKKNRYKDILPYDQTRVPLTLMVEEEQTDYINASFIQGLDHQQRYIATQGPLKDTMVDFWRMIWEYQVKVIVMACREVELGKKKCERYWPLDQEPSSFGPFTVFMVETTKPNPEVFFRTLRVNFQGEDRNIHHFQYVAWPDRGIPSTYDCFLEMISLMRLNQGESRVPLCIHCSAGCGRTGVICTVEYIQELICNQKIPTNFSIFQIVLEMRKQRPSAVQTKEQYEFVYRAVVEMLHKKLTDSNVNYENLKENTVLFYDDAVSLKTDKRTKPPPHRPSIYSRTISVPAEPVLPLPDTRRTWDMNDTYAVVNKIKKRTASPGPGDACNQLPPVKYDNVPVLSQGSPDQAVYSSVRPRSRICTSPTTQTPLMDSNKLDGSQQVKSNYHLVRPPTPQEKPLGNKYATDTDTREEGGTNDGTWAYSIPAYQAEKVEPGIRRPPSPCQNSSAKPIKVRQFLPTVLMSAGRKAPGTSKTLSEEDYEDVPDPTKSSKSSLSPSNGLGFNYRIGRPKGPRDPPAEWSR